MLRIIGVEEHAWTPSLHARLMALPYEVAGSHPTPGVASKLDDLGDQRIADMDGMGLDVQVLSVTTPGTQVLERGEAVALAREANDALTAVAAADPRRFACFATLPTPDPAAAVEELERCVTELGHCGVMLHGRTGDKTIDDPAFASIFDTAARLKVPVHLHPQRPADSVSEFYYMRNLPTDIGRKLSTSAFGWHVETAVNAIRLILSGAFERAPGLQIILGHWGELVAFFLERIDDRLGVASGQTRFAETFLEHFYLAPAGIWSYPMLTHAMSIVGADRLLYSVDYPFIVPTDGQARRFLEEAPISPGDKHKIAHLNAERLLGLDP